MKIEKLGLYECEDKQGNIYTIEVFKIMRNGITHPVLALFLDSNGIPYMSPFTLDGENPSYTITKHITSEGLIVQNDKIEVKYR